MPGEPLGGQSQAGATVCMYVLPMAGTEHLVLSLLLSVEYILVLATWCVSICSRAAVWAMAHIIATGA